MLFMLTDSPQKLNLENIHDTLIILFYVSLFFSYEKHTKKQVELQWTPNI